MQPQQSRKHGHLYATSMSHPLSYVPLFMRMCIFPEAPHCCLQRLHQLQQAGMRITIPPQKAGLAKRWWRVLKCMHGDRSRWCDYTESQSLAWKNHCHL
jgi:hypothetical protein